MSNGAGWFERPQVERTIPERGAAYFYRNAADGGRAIGGIPLDSTEAVVVSAVRMAYRVAEAQIDRSARLARRLREEGDRASGPRSDRQALDATERLVFRAMMGLLGWVEGAASERGNPLKRLAVAEYRLLGSLLGLTSSKAPRTEEEPASEPRRAAAASPGRAGDQREESPLRFPVLVKHIGKERRAVRVSAWEYAADVRPPVTVPVKFYSVDQRSRRTLAGEVVIASRRSVTLTLAISQSVPGGLWRAALCDASGVQMGHIEIML